MKSLFGLLTVFCLCGCRGETATPAPGATTASDSQVAPVPSVTSDGFRLLTLADFETFPPDAHTWSEQDGLLICSGQPKGYAYSREEFSDFTIRAEYRFVPQSDAVPDRYNTGFMIHIQEPHKVWPASLEVQGRQDEVARIKSNGGVAELEIRDDPEARMNARRPAGEWNTIEIVSRNGALTSTLNGVPICSSEPGTLTSGRIGLQSEGYEVHFRQLRIRVDAPPQ